MDSPAAVSLTTHFATLTDPRVERTRDHSLLAIITIALCAVVCGADSWVEVEAFGNAKRPWLDSLLDLPHGIPSHDTFGRVFAALDPVQFQTCFLAWVQATVTHTEGQVIALDGKTVRHSHNRSAGKAAIHMVSAWASANHLVLGQMVVDEKSNEITALPALLAVLMLRGCIVTIDALGCQKEIAARIVAQDADYVLALKGNHGTLHAEVQTLFADTDAVAFATMTPATAVTVDKGHGRVEVRRAWTVSDPTVLTHLDPDGAWAGLRAVGMVEAERRTGESLTRERRYYLTSVTDAAAFGRAVRAHWGIENGLHWVLDIAFREDESRVRIAHGPENFAVLRHMAVNLLKGEHTAKVGVKAKRLKAGWDEHYLLTILAG